MRTRFILMLAAFCGGVFTVASLSLAQKGGEEKGKKDKGPKGEGKEKGKTEEAAIRKFAEKVAKDGGAPDPEKWLKDSAKLFQILDRNRDNLLTGDEIPEGLLVVIDRADKSKDNAIDLDEYRDYLQGRVQTESQFVTPKEKDKEKPTKEERIREATSSLDKKPLDPDEVRPTVYRDPKQLPKDFPSWFLKLDTDHDLQVGLYEWRAAGRLLDEFNTMDLNGDGYLTIEEYLRWKKQASEVSTKK
jgi:hypothetical protein